MKSRPFTPTKHIWVPILIGVCLLPIPLLGDFHIESAMLTACAGCFWAGWRSCKPCAASTSDFWCLLYVLTSIYLIAVPLLLFALLTGCFSWHGVGFWVLYPAPSVLFGYAIGRLIRISGIRFKKTITVLLLQFCAVGVLCIEFFNLPQVYFFNQVWGGWPGPIYDETVDVSMLLLLFRGLTIAWAGLFWWLPAFKRSAMAKGIVVICLTLLAAGYSCLPQMGIISPRSYLQQQLGGVKKTPHFTIYYAQEYYSRDEINLIALEHEFYLQQITGWLHLNKPDSSHTIESYLYAHAWQKKELVGAKYTSYVPVWLSRDQLHIAKQQLAGTLKHELVHILAKQFGNTLLNASWSIGLVEGLAVALVPDVSAQATIHQLVASQKPWPATEKMKQALSFWGFYGGRSTVSYTTTGSFVQYLLRNYPIQSFKKAYRTANVDKAYGEPFSTLIEEWHAVLDTVEVDSAGRQIASKLFGLPSLFEQSCPHIQSAFAQNWDSYRYFWYDGDTTKALQRLNRARLLAQNNEYVLQQWTFQQLSTGHYNKVQQIITVDDSSSVQMQLLYADAFVLNGKIDSARYYLQAATKQLTHDSTSTTPFGLEVRQDSEQWKHYVQVVYKDALYSNTDFLTWPYSMQLQATIKAIEKEQWDKFDCYARELFHQPLDKQYFGTYLAIIHYLGYMEQFKVAKKWIKKVEPTATKKRYKQRLVQQKAWISFLKQN